MMVLFLKITVSVMCVHCDYSPQVPKDLGMPVVVSE
jgi:hypothetical protein